MVHTHPAVRIERDAAKEMRLSLKQLGLDPGVLGAKRR
jgi:phage terminase small subunit